MSSPIERLKKLTNKISSYEISRKENLKILEKLYRILEIDEKVEEFKDLFNFKAINLSGASLLAENLGEIREGKYLQILAISYDKHATKKSTNISLAYFGKAKFVDEKVKDMVVEFIIRYRFEKSFMTLENYYDMIKGFEVDG